MIDQIIETYKTERPGNDSWLKFKLTLGYDWEDLVLCLSENHSGWNGPYRDSRSFKIEDFQGEELIAKIKEYVNDFSDDEKEEKRVLESLQIALNSKNISVILIEPQVES